MAMIKYSSLSTEHYSAIIFALLDGDKTPAQIADVCDKAFTTIKEELNVLKEEKLIEITKLVDKNRRKKNEKYMVKLKFGMLCKEFVEYVLNKTNKAKLTKILYSQLLKNPYLLEILYRSLMDNKKEEKLKTIENIFEKVLMQLIYAYPPHNDSVIEEFAEKKESLATFLRFTKIIEDYLVPDTTETTQDFYDEIREERVKFTYLNFQKK
jgi:hypothetical protein